MGSYLDQSPLTACQGKGSHCGTFVCRSMHLGVSPRRLPAWTLLGDAQGSGPRVQGSPGRRQGENSDAQGEKCWTPGFRALHAR